MSTLYDTKDLRAENLQLDNILDEEYIGPVQFLLNKINPQRLIENTDIPNYIKIEFQKGFGKTHAAMRYLAENYDNFSHIIFKDSGKFEIINYSKIDETFNVGRRTLKNLDEIDKIDNDAVIFDDIHYIFESFLNGELKKSEVADYLNKINESKEKRTTIAITDTLLNNYLTPGEFTEHLGSEVCNFFREFNDMFDGACIRQGDYSDKLNVEKHSLVYHSKTALKEKIKNEISQDSDIYNIRDEKDNLLWQDSWDNICYSVFELGSGLLEKLGDLESQKKEWMNDFDGSFKILYELVMSARDNYFKENENIAKGKDQMDPFFNFIDVSTIQFRDTSLFQKLIQYSSSLNIREMKRLSNKLENKSLEDSLHDSLFVNQESSMDVMELFENRFEISKRIGYAPFKEERDELMGEVSELYDEIQRREKYMDRFNNAIKLMEDSPDDWRKRQEIKSDFGGSVWQKLASVGHDKMNEEFEANINEVKTKLIDHNIYGGSLSEKERHKKIDKYIAGLEKPALPDKDTLWQIVSEMENRLPVTVEDSKFIPVDDFLMKLLLHDIEEPVFTSDWSSIRNRFAIIN